MSFLKKKTVEKFIDKRPVVGSVCRVEDELFKDGDTEKSWRIFKIMTEFVSGFEVLKKYGLAATFFGTARCKDGDIDCKMARDLAHRLSDDGFAIITGGGGGVMSSANRGAYEAGGHSIGLNIHLPEEQHLNPFVTDSQSFYYFFVRKVMLSYASEVYIFMPGGFGTLDEFFEIVTLVQTKKIAPIPIVLVGKKYWTPLIAWMNEVLYEQKKYINKEDIELFHLVDTVDEAHELIRTLVPC